MSRLFEPELGEEYYVACPSRPQNRTMVHSFKWSNDEYDQMLYDRGMVRKTEGEALEDAKLIIKVMNELTWPGMTGGQDE